MALEALAVDITGSATVVAYDILGDNVRITKQLTEVIATSTADVRATQQFAEILASSTADIRVTQQFVEVLAPSFTTEDLATDITGSVLVGANLERTVALVTNITGSALLVGQLVESTDLVADITSSVLVVSNLARTRSLATDITGSALLVGQLVESTDLATDITGSALVVAALGETTPLATDITGSALVVAALSESTFLATNITGSALVTANLLLPPLKVDINATGTVAPNLVTPQPLVPWGGIEVTATVTALFDKNLEHTTSSLSITQSAVAFNEHLGNTVVDLDQTVTVEITLGPSADNSLDLVQTLESDVVYILDIETVWGTLNHLAEFKHTLPTETASNTITFTGAADFSRLAQNTLNLTQAAVGSIGGTEEDVSNSLSLTSTAALDTILEVSLIDPLILTQVVDPDQVIVETLSNTLAFNQLALNIALGTNLYGRIKQYVILQAPFGALQTSVVLPSPLWGDTENVTSEMSLRRSMNGATKTFVKTNKNRRLTYTFRILDELKALELIEFCRYYNSDKIRLTNWKGEVWKVNLLTNPFDFVQTRRSGIDIALELEGEKLYG